MESEQLVTVRLPAHTYSGHWTVDEARSLAIRLETADYLTSDGPTLDWRLADLLSPLLSVPRCAVGQQPHRGIARNAY